MFFPFIFHFVTKPTQICQAFLVHDKDQADHPKKSQPMMRKSFRKKISLKVNALYQVLLVSLPNPDENMDITRESEGSLTAVPSLLVHNALKQEQRKEGNGEFLREDCQSVELATWVA